MHGEEHSNVLVVEVSGRPLAENVAARLHGGYVDDSSNVPDLFVLRFDEDPAVLERAAVRIGAPVRLLVQSSGSGTPAVLLTGEVTAVETEISASGCHTIVRGLDRSHRLFRGRRVEAYLQSTPADIVRAVAGRAGIEVGRVDHQGPVLAHVAQDGINDWEFLRRLADEVGAVLAVVDGALDFTAPTEATSAPSGERGSREDPFVIQRGVNLTDLRATVTAADQVAEVEVRGWDVEAKRELVGTAQASTVSASLADVDPAALASTFDSPRYVAPFSMYDQQSQCDLTAQAIAGHLAGAFAELEGTVRGNPNLRAGTAVALTDVGRPFDGRYTLSGTRHDFSPEAGYVTSFTVSNHSERSMYGVSAGASMRPPTVQGVVSAKVTAVRDPDERGRVKVTFPVLSGSYESWWARTVQLGAGPERGSIVLPEVGDEVLVAFGQGSFQQPYVLGGLYNGQDKPTEPWADHVGGTDGAIQRRAFVSRTGMLIEFVETPSDEKLTLSTSDGAQRISLVQAGEAAIEIIAEGPVTITAKQNVSVSTDTGDVMIKGANVTLEATSALELKGTNVNITGTAGADVKAPAVKLTGDATAEVAGGATTTIRGGIVRIN